ncbi:MAG: DUF2175 domain-containing protein [Desulfurococcales archaeon]|nr:DUF2175 domain-containing protein [Desulfurococcales archaeon]
MKGLRKWKCHLCGQDIIEGQRFLFVPGKGYVHIECYYERVKASNAERDVMALMDANEVLTYAIVRLKEAGRIAASDELREEILSARRRIEELAERLERLLHEKAPV